MAITQGTSEGLGIITQVYYQSQPWLTVTMLGFLKSAEMIGRVLGGFFSVHEGDSGEKALCFYKVCLYFYNIIDMVLLFLPYPAMLASRFCAAVWVSAARPSARLR